MPRPYEFLRQILETDNIAIIRTITNGIPHWIIVYNYDEVGNKFYILDPNSPLYGQQRTKN